MGFNIKIFREKGVSQADLKRDSINWGNYMDNKWTITNANLKYSSNYGNSWEKASSMGKALSSSILLSTGASESFSKMGIYDLAGNVLEWTLEYTSSTYFPCASRGGNYNNSGSSIPASIRYSVRTTGLYDGIGFRLALY